MALHAFVQSLRKSLTRRPSRWKMYGQSKRRAFQRRSMMVASSPVIGRSLGCVFFENSAGRQIEPSSRE
jgi:hypothetical protein